MVSTESLRKFNFIILFIDLVLLLYLGYLISKDGLSIEIPLILGLISIAIGIVSFVIAQANIHAFYLRITNDVDNDLIKIRSSIKDYKKFRQIKLIELIYKNTQPARIGLSEIKSNAKALQSHRRGVVWRINKYITQAKTLKFWILNKRERTKVANQLIRLIDEILIWDENDPARVINDEAGNIIEATLSVLDFKVEKWSIDKLIKLFEKHIAVRRRMEKKINNKAFVNNVLSDFKPEYNKKNNSKTFQRLTIQRRNELIKIQKQIDKTQNKTKK